MIGEYKTILESSTKRTADSISFFFRKRKKHCPPCVVATAVCPIPFLFLISACTHFAQVVKVVPLVHDTLTCAARRSPSEMFFQLLLNLHQVLYSSNEIFFIYRQQVFRDATQGNEVLL